MAVPEGLGEFVGLSTRSGSAQVTKFLQGGARFLLAGGLSSGVKLDRRRDRLPSPGPGQDKSLLAICLVVKRE